MSCTDDKTACPCEPGEELRRFEAADLKNAVLTNNGANEDGDEDEYNEEGSWYMLEGGVNYPNPDYDKSLYAEHARLWDVAYAVRTGPDGTWQTRSQSPEWIAAAAYDAEYGDKLYQTRNKPWTFKWNGKELPVEVVEDNGGTEGGGEAVHMVYKVCDRLFRLDGSYYSYDGTTWDDDSFREVKAVTKAVVFYE